MPKDALLYERLEALGLASRTFTPTIPDFDTICLVRVFKTHSVLAAVLTSAVLGATEDGHVLGAL